MPVRASIGLHSLLPLRHVKGEDEEFRRELREVIEKSERWYLERVDRA